MCFIHGKGDTYMDSFYQAAGRLPCLNFKDTMLGKAEILLKSILLIYLL